MEQILTAHQMKTPSYSDGQRALDRIEVDMELAECHGIISALLCARAGFSDAELLQELLGEDAQAPHAESCRALLRNLHQVSAASLGDGEMSFDLLLPDDDEAMPTRCRAFASWCQGFLYGLGAGGIKRFDQFDTDSREVIADLTAFAQMSNESDEDQSAEADYVELVEYTRVGVMLIYEELAEPPPSVH